VVSIVTQVVMIGVEREAWRAPRARLQYENESHKLESKQGLWPEARPVPLDLPEAMGGDGHGAVGVGPDSGIAPRGQLLRRSAVLLCGKLLTRRWKSVP